MGPSCRLGPATTPPAIPSAHADHLPPRPRAARGVAVLVDRLRRSPADRDDRAGHRPAHQHAHRLVRPRRDDVGGLPGLGRRRGPRHQPVDGPARPAPAPALRWRRSTPLPARGLRGRRGRWSCRASSRPWRSRWPGATQPAIGSMVRARWAAAAPDARAPAQRVRAREHHRRADLHRRAAASRPSSPSRWRCRLPLLVAAGIGLVGGLVLAAQRRTEPPPSGRRARRERGGAEGAAPCGSRGWPARGRVRSASAACSARTRSTVVAFTEQAGQSGASGIILGLWAFGSMLGGIVFGSRQWGRPLPQQVVILTGVLDPRAAPGPFVPDDPDAGRRPPSSPASPSPRRSSRSSR